MEILALLMDEIGGESWQEDRLDQLSDDLISRGYTEPEIDAAFSWLYHRIELNADNSLQNARSVCAPAPTSHRVLAPQERELLTPQAYGYLLRLLRMKVLTLAEMEDVIERVISLDLTTLSLDDAQEIAQAILFENALKDTEKPWRIGLIRNRETLH